MPDPVSGEVEAQTRVGGIINRENEIALEGDVDGGSGGERGLRLGLAGCEANHNGEGHGDGCVACFLAAVDTRSDFAPEVAILLARRAWVGVEHELVVLERERA